MSDNVEWYHQKVTRQDHEVLNGHLSLCLWFTGLSGSGKSTLANALQKQLHQRKVHSYLLDGDNVRHGLNMDLGFSPGDRRENVRRVAQVANLFVDAGVVVITALISPYEHDRQIARHIHKPGDFIEIFVNCPIETCIERDPKGLYKKAQAGIIRDFTGISSPYEAPMNPELIVNTAEYSVDECVDQILAYLKYRLYVTEGNL